MKLATRLAGHRPLVWIIGVAAAIEAVLQAIVSAVHDLFVDASVWILGAVFVFTLAFLVETLKRMEDE